MPGGAERRRWTRHPCRRLVVARLPDAEGEWRWHWVSDISAGGLAVSFLARPARDRAIEATLLDVDLARSFPLGLQFAWHDTGPPPRTGFTYAVVSPELEEWLREFADHPHPPHAACEGRSA